MQALVGLDEVTGVGPLLPQPVQDFHVEFADVGCRVVNQVDAGVAELQPSCEVAVVDADEPDLLLAVFGVGQLADGPVLGEFVIVQVGVLLGVHEQKCVCLIDGLADLGFEIRGVVDVCQVHPAVILNLRRKLLQETVDEPFVDSFVAYEDAFRSHNLATFGAKVRLFWFTRSFRALFCTFLTIVFSRLSLFSDAKIIKRSVCLLFSNTYATKFRALITYFNEKLSKNRCIVRRFLVTLPPNEANITQKS